MEITEKKMREMFQDFGKEFRRVINGDIRQAIEDNNRIICDLLRQEIRASETRTTTTLRQEIQETKNEIVSSFYDVLDRGVLPQIDDLDHRVTRLERRFGHS